MSGITPYYQRHIEGMLIGKRSHNKIRLIFGARQTGKTLLLKHLLAGESSVIYNLQDTRIRQQFESNPSSLSEELRALDKRIVNVGIDEIQKVPALLEEVQLLYDEDPGRRQFFLTGSSARKLRQHSANLLPGRSHIYHLHPVVRPEETGFEGFLSGVPVSTGNPFPERTLEDRLVFGNLPGIRREPPDTAAATLESYVENYIEEEIRREGLVRNVGAFHIFLRLAAVESGSQTNMARLSQECGVPASTLRTYYQVLADTFVGCWVHAYGAAGRKRLLTTPRFLFFDMGVRNAAARMPFVRHLMSDMGGRLLEQWVGLELLHRASYAGRQYEVTFWRTTSGVEVDYVWQSPEEHIPVEVKWSENPQPKDARHVETFLNLYPKKAGRGLVVCRVSRARQLTKRTTAIPWHAL